MPTVRKEPTPDNEYRPWEAEGITELEYTRRNYIKARKAMHALWNALATLTYRCDGPEGVTEDGSNIHTMDAHAVLERYEGECA